MGKHVHRSIDVHHAGHGNKRRDLELDVPFESGDGGAYAIRIEKLEKRISANGGRTHCGRPHESRSLL